MSSEAINLKPVSILKAHQEMNPVAVFCMSIKEGQIRFDYDNMDVVTLAHLKRYVSKELDKLLEVPWNNQNPRNNQNPKT